VTDFVTWENRKYDKKLFENCMEESIEK